MVAQFAWWLRPAGVAAFWLTLAVAAPFCTAPAQSREPVPRIEAETHTAQMRDAATDASGHILITVSEDKAARVCSLPDLRLFGICSSHFDR